LKGSRVVRHGEGNDDMVDSGAVFWVGRTGWMPSEKLLADGGGVGEWYLLICIHDKAAAG
jgi:hypothetical protein